MSVVWSIVGMAAGVYAVRLAGLAARDVTVPSAWERALEFVPVAVLSALVVSVLTAPADTSADRLVAAAGAVLIARRTGRMWACIVGGMALYWFLRLV